jgi:ATP-grasp domain, R2K clade family 3
MLMLYCADPLSRHRPDGAYAAEVTAAEALGIEYALLNFEALVDEEAPQRAVRAVPEQVQEGEERQGIYRGWMLRPGQYAQLYTALLERGVRLINDPDTYARTHLLPNWYGRIAEHTPRSVWLPLQAGEAPDEEMLTRLLQTFGDHPLIVKDYVKSRKHEWAEACFIPSASDRQGVERVVRRFRELQGSDLEGGLVFREYVEYKPLGAHSRSGMPLTREYRIFWLDNTAVATMPYWEEGDYPDDGPPLSDLRELAVAVGSRFFTMDVAGRRADDVWQVVELGDGQVAGLPERANINDFYAAVSARVRRL